MVGFKRTDLGASHYAATLTNGPDAYDGTNTIYDEDHPEWGRRNRDVLTSDIPLYFRRIK